MNFRADLHCHSICSDGSLLPCELVDRAFEKGLKVLSITDHDTVDAYKTAVPYAQKKGLELLTGVEISAGYYGKSVHILVYGFDQHDDLVLALCERSQMLRKERVLEMMRLCQKLGLDLDLKPQEISSVGRVHVAKKMLEKGYVKSLVEAFDRYIGAGKPCYVPSAFVDVEKVLELGQLSGAAVVIAHPDLIPQELCQGLLELAFDGIEVFYANIPPHKQMRWQKVAAKHRFLRTGGSDFHGNAKPELDLGASWLGKEDFDILCRRIADKKRISPIS